MAARAFGALLALAAAALFVVSLLAAVFPQSPIGGWWDGHPVIAGKASNVKDVHAGVLGATGCDTGGDGRCQALGIDSQLELIGIPELVVIAFAAGFAGVLALAAWRVGERRKALAKIVLGITGVAAIGAGLLIVQGPSIHYSQPVAVPVGVGMMMLWVGVGAATVGAVLVLRIEREPLRLKVTHHGLAADLPPPVDMRQLLRDQRQGLRPSEPILGAPLPPSPGGSLAGPAGPLGPVGGAPRFGGAPQLRPLYDVHNAGFVPTTPPPPLPLRAPTPIPRASIGAIVGIPTPHSLPVTTPPEPVTIATMAPDADPRAESEPIPPPPPAKIATKPPSKIATKPPRPRLDDLPKLAPTGRSQHTIAHSVPPMPTVENQPAPGVLPAREVLPRGATDADSRLETAMRDTDIVTAVEIDAEAKAAATAVRAAADTQMKQREDETAQLLEGTDTGVEVRAAAPTDRIAAEEPEPRKLAMSTAPASLPPPKQGPTTTSGPTPACPQCEAPMAWVEEHLRFYCKQCRMYF